VWHDNNSSQSKMKYTACSQNITIVDEMSPDTVSGFSRMQIASLDDVYDVETVLGRGGFGIVQKAVLRSGGPVSAVKSIAKVSHITEAMANTEIRVLQGLNHTNICKLLAVYEDFEHVHLVLEYVHGRELFDEISSDGPMQESRAACIMKQVFVALQYCHKLDPAIIHRDVKPENIMIEDAEGSDKPQVKIIDWGLAAACRGTIETPLVGTPCYMAPESLSVGIYSRASDMWGAGAVLFSMLTGGELPQQFNPLCSSNGLQASLLHEVGTSDAAQDILHGLLKRTPEQRLTATSAATHPWTMGQSSAPACIADEDVHVHCSPDIVQCTSLSLTSITVSLKMEVGYDFTVFDDFEQVHLPGGMAKQHLHQGSDGIRNDIPDGVLQMSASKPRHPLHGRVIDCKKENLGPCAPRACLKRRAGPAVSPLKCSSSKDSLRPRPLR